MRAKVGCIPCYLKHALTAIREVEKDPQKQREILNQVAQMLPDLTFEQTPAGNSTIVLREVCRLLNEPDPFARLKAHYNKLALSLYPELKKIVNESSEPLDTALKIAVAGNIIDLGILKVGNLEIETEDALNKGFAIDHRELFKKDLSHTEDILYIGDNAGETVFDRVFIEELSKQGKKVIFVVRGEKVLNDATMEDAIAVGIDKVAEIVENGSSWIGTELGTCSPEFRRLFERSKLIISKGQANFETLSDVGGNIYFILRAKCEEVALELGVQLRDIVIANSNMLRKQQKQSETM
jgi:uncharacterized protein with ATP-grasp and redox domains